MVKKSSPFLRWARGQEKAWEKALGAMEKGLIGTHEIRHGRIVDTTVDRMAEISERLAELKILIANHEAHNA
jgi:hypothetical protein